MRVCLWRGLPRYFYCGCKAEKITLLSYKSQARKAYYSYLTTDAVARSVACKLRKQVLQSILAPGTFFRGNSTLIRLRIFVFTQLKCLKKQLKFIGLRNKKQLKSSIRKGKNTSAYRLISLLGGEKSTRRLVPGSIKIRETAENQYWFFRKWPPGGS